MNAIPEIVELPEGFFLMGCEQGQENERPVHRVWLDGFGIGRFPVTNREYEVFAAQTQISPPPFCRYFTKPAFAASLRPGFSQLQ